MLEDDKEACRQMKLLGLLNGWQWIYLSLDSFIFPINYISTVVGIYSMYKWSYLSVKAFERKNTKQTAKNLRKDSYKYKLNY